MEIFLDGQGAAVAQGSRFCVDDGSVAEGQLCIARYAETMVLACAAADVYLCVFKCDGRVPFGNRNAIGRLCGCIGGSYGNNRGICRECTAVCHGDTGG